MQGEGLKPDPGSYKFLADAMLGKLALWMRAAGYDTAYERAIGDAELVRRAAAGRRVILTRDTLLILRKRARGNYLFIESDKWREQLGQVLGVYPIGKEKSLTRCLRCNTLLEDIPRASIKAGKAGKTGAGVPPYVLETHKRFSACRLCGRIYWAGTHRDEIMKELELVREAAGLKKVGFKGGVVRNSTFVSPLIVQSGLNRLEREFSRRGGLWVLLGFWLWYRWPFWSRSRRGAQRSPRTRSPCY